MKPTFHAIDRCTARSISRLSLLLCAALTVPAAFAGVVPETTFSWNGGLGKWSQGSKWTSGGITGFVPDSPLHAVKIGENNFGNVTIDFGNWFECGTLRIEANNILNITSGQLIVQGPNEDDYIENAGKIRGKGQIILTQSQAFQSVGITFEGDSATLQGENDGYLSGGEIVLQQNGPTNNGESCQIQSYFGTLTNDDWLIRGNGTVNIKLKQNPNACIRADVPNQVLDLPQVVEGNLGVIEADGGQLHFSIPVQPWENGIVQWRSDRPLDLGTIRTKNGGKILALSRDIQSGTLENITTGPNAQGSFIIKGKSFLKGLPDKPLTIRGKIDLIDEEEHPVTNPTPLAMYTHITGDIVNEGEIRVKAAAFNSSGPSVLRLTDPFSTESSSFSGGGKMVFDLPEGSSARFLINAPYSYTASATNFNHTWEFLNDATLEGSINNATGGVIKISGASNVLSSNGLFPFVNQGGTISVNDGAILRIWRYSHFENPNGFDNRNGTIQINGNNTPAASRMEFVNGGAGSYLQGGIINNQGGRFICGGVPGESVKYPSGWSTQRTFKDVQFTGSSTNGIAEFEAGAETILSNCMFNGTTHVRGGVIVTNNNWDPANETVTYLHGDGSIVMADGTWEGVTYPAEIHAQPYSSWTASNTLSTSCKIRGKGKIRAKKLNFTGNGGLVIDGAQNDIQLVDCQDITGSGSLEVINGGKLRIDASPLGMKLPSGLIHTVSQNGQLVIGGAYDVTVGKLTSLLANDGGSLLANDGASLLANDGGSLIANDGGSIVAGGAGNIMAENGGRIVASGGGNIVAAGGGNIVAAGGGNILAIGGASIVASGGGNIVAAGAGNLIAGTGALLKAGNSIASRSNNGGSSPCILIQSGGRLAPTSALGTDWPLSQQTGIASLEGNLDVEVGGMVQCEIGGLAAGTGYDRTEVTGNVNYTGILEVRVIKGFVTSLLPSHSFTVLTATGAITGTPSNLVGGRIPTIDGMGSFRFTADGESFVLDDFQLTPGLVETFASFATTNNLSGNPQADADQDGTTDFAEYAFSTNPIVADVPATAEFETIEEVKYLVLRYRVKIGRLATGLTVQAEGCADLSSWSTQNLVDDVDQTAPIIPGTEARIAKMPISATTGFLRLKASMP